MTTFIHDTCKRKIKECINKRHFLTCVEYYDYIDKHPLSDYDVQQYLKNNTKLLLNELGYNIYTSPHVRIIVKSGYSKMQILKFLRYLRCEFKNKKFKILDSYNDNSL